MTMHSVCGELGGPPLDVQVGAGNQSGGEAASDVVIVELGEVLMGEVGGPV